MRQAQKSKHHKPTTTVVNVVSAARATATAVTAVSVASADREMKARLNKPSSISLRMTLRLMNKPHIRHTKHTRPMSHISHVNRVNHARDAKRTVTAQSV